MKKYVCSVCGYRYDEAQGIPGAGIAPGTKWENLPIGWVCPLCGATKSEFKEQGAAISGEKRQPLPETAADNQELSPLESSALCSNLARGCEKQYLTEEAALFTELAVYFKSVAAPAREPQYPKLLELIEQDLAEGFVAANALSAEQQDRGALRALTWSEKVTRILKSLLTRYEKQGDAMLQNTGVYVCTICGFLYVGDTPPEICPVCKVPRWKFAEITGRAM